VRAQARVGPEVEVGRAAGVAVAVRAAAVVWAEPVVAEELGEVLAVGGGPAAQVAEALELGRGVVRANRLLENG
jgi:hypothetical protein